MKRAFCMILCGLAGHMPSFASIDIVKMYTSAYIEYHIYVEHLGLEPFPFDGSSTNNPALDKFTMSLHTKRKVPTMVLINCDMDFPLGDASISYDIFLNRLTRRWHRWSNGQDEGIVIRYNADVVNWEEIKNLVRYAVNNVDSIRKYQRFVCRTYEGSRYDAATNASVPETQTDTAGFTIGRGYVQAIRMGMQNVNLRKEPSGAQFILNLLFCLKWKKASLKEEVYLSGLNCFFSRTGSYSKTINEYLNSQMTWYSGDLVFGS